MNNEQYLATGGNYCPKCSSEKIEAGTFEADSGYASQSVECLSCSFKWFDLYELKGFEAKNS